MSGLTRVQVEFGRATVYTFKQTSEKPTCAVESTEVPLNPQRSCELAILTSLAPARMKLPCSCLGPAGHDPCHVQLRWKEGWKEGRKEGRKEGTRSLVWRHHPAGRDRVASAQAPSTFGGRATPAARRARRARY